MRRLPVRTALVAAAAGLLAALSTSSALAHEHRDVGPYQLVVGWKVEPAYSDVQNAIQVTVRDRAGQPVTGAGESLRVQVVHGDRTTAAMPLEPGEAPGVYEAAILPTRAGGYTFHVAGSIRGQGIDQSFSSSDRTFEDVRSGAEIEFPARDPSRGELAQFVGRDSSRVQARLDNLQAQLDQERAAARRDLAIGLAGTVLGLMGAGALAIAVVRERRRRRTPAKRAVSPTRKRKGNLVVPAGMGE